VNPLVAAAIEIQTDCRLRGWRFCVIGGFAVLRWGEPRATRDIDLTLLTGFGGEAPYVDGLLGRYKPRIEDARAFALLHRVLLLESSNGTPLDIALGAMPFEERMVSRASDWPIEPGCAVSTCSAEDLIVFKTFAARERDWLDIEGIVARRGPQLDQRLIWSELTPLLELKHAPSAAERLRALLAAS
jgi:hypothetical protein